MNLGLQPYPAYKDSGAPWMGAVPDHWTVAPNRALFREVNERDHSDEPMLSVTITRGVVRQSQLLEDSAKKDSSREDKSAYKLVRPGDVAYNKMRAWQGAIGVSEFRGIVSPAYVVQRLRRSSLPRYYHHLLRTPAFAKEAERWSYGITSDMWSLRAEHFKLIVSCAPPIEEQEAIVRYLDHMDRRIRRYIHAKQKLIKLLEEQKQVIIHQAVTGQIDVSNSKPYSAYQDSGVEWIGSIPSHWQTVRNKGVCRLGTGHTPSRHVPEYWVDCTIPWCTLADVHQIRNDRQKYIGHTEECLSELGIAHSAAQKLPAGTVVLSRTASVGFSGILEREMATSQDFMAWIPGPLVQSEYLLLVLRSMRPEFRRLMRGSTHNTIYMPVLHDFRMPLPPRDDQVRIVSYVESATTSVGSLVACSQAEIELYRDFRTRLIADVVTGKLDVREVAANLPYEAEESESLEDGGLLADDEAGEPVDGETVLEEIEA